MEEIEGFFVIVVDMGYGVYQVEGPFAYEVALDYKHVFTEEGKDCKLAKLSWLD